LVIIARIPGIKAEAKLRQRNKIPREAVHQRGLDQALGSHNNHINLRNNRNHTRGGTTKQEKNR